MFETPLFLLAVLVGAMIPLILHMMRKRRSQPVPFPALRFLQMAQHASSRRVRIENLLLWLLRTLIMIFLGTAFAMPVLRTAGGGFLGRASRDIAIVLDRSYTMHYLAGRETAFASAVDVAVDLIEGLNEGDRYFIVEASDRPRALIAEPIRDKETGIARLRSLQPAHAPSRLSPAIRLARDILQETAGRRETELHILTDNRAQAWVSTTGSGAVAGETAGDKSSLPTFVTLTGVPAPENLAPAMLRLTPPVLFPGGGARLSVDLAHTGPPRETTLIFWLNEREHARRAVVAGTPSATDISFTVPSLAPGVHAARVSLPPDSLMVDDDFHFLIRVRERMPTLVVGQPADTFFIRTALQATAGGDAAYDAVTPEALGQHDLGGYATIFLCNALPLTGQTIGRVERYVQRGGLLVIFPGFRASPADYRAWNMLPAMPSGIRDVPRTRVRQNLIWSEAGHPVLDGMEEALTTPVIALERHLSWETVEPQATELIGLQDGSALLLERTVGQGRVVLSAISADRAWSNFPLTPFYLPLIAQLVSYGGMLGAQPPFRWSSRDVAADEVLPDAGPETVIRGPDGRIVPIRSTMREGRAVAYMEELMEPGIYLRGDVDPPEPVLAVNLSRAGADLTPVDTDTMKAVLGVDRLHVATDRETLAALLQDHRVGRTYGELLLWLALILLVVEFTYANRLAHRGVRLTDQIKVDASGRVRGHVALTPPAGEGG